MVEKQVIVVAVEDSATGSVVAAAAAHLAMDRDAVSVVLLHVLENRTVISGMQCFPLSNLWLTSRLDGTSLTTSTAGYIPPSFSLSGTELAAQLVAPSESPGSDVSAKLSITTSSTVSWFPQGMSHDG